MTTRATTAEIVGKAHKLREQMLTPQSWGGANLDRYVPLWIRCLEKATPIHCGDVEKMIEAPMNGLSSNSLQLPFEIALIEFDWKIDWQEVAPEHDEQTPSTIFSLCTAGVVHQTQAHLFTRFKHPCGDIRWAVLGGIVLEIVGGRAMCAPMYIGENRAYHDDEPNHAVLMMLGEIVATTLISMNCSNVVYVEHAAPQALNRKRLKSGKVPLYTYKTLHVVSNREVRKNHHASDSDRAAPRLHLRRGHIRRIGNERMVWVQPCMVGDPERGRVVNAYSVSRGPAHG